MHHPEGLENTVCRVCRRPSDRRGRCSVLQCFCNKLRIRWQFSMPPVSLKPRKDSVPCGFRQNRKLADTSISVNLQVRASTAVVVSKAFAPKHLTLAHY